MGQVKDSIKQKGKGTHFTWDERLKLESYLQGKGRFPKITRTKELAIRLEKSQRTIQREIQRGMVEHQHSELYYYFEYNAEYAHNAAKFEKSAKGPPLKLGDDTAFVAAVSNQIVTHKYSPYAVLQNFELNSWPSDLRICEKTLYGYIYEGLIEGVSQKNLLYKGKRRKPKGAPARHQRVRCAERSISKRPKEADDRSEFGHWEIDTVVGPQGGKPACIMTLTERKLRVEIAEKIPSRTSKEVCSALDQLERKIGTKKFKKVFKSITGDCGGEFMDYEKLECSYRGGGSVRTAFYYAHPYRSSERGSNEQANGMIRRFFPKGTDLSKVSKKEIKKVQYWMNNYPRKILGGLTANLLIQKEIGKDFVFS